VVAGLTLSRRQVIGSFLAGFWARAFGSARAALNPIVPDAKEHDLAEGFASPPPSARPWVYWFWINGNISKEGITADLEALKGAGIGGVLWMEVSGPWWAPDGDVIPLSPRWHELIQWAVGECQRLGLDFDMTLDFGYGSGGPHISPERSMQQIVWTEKELEGGKRVDVVLDKPKVDKPVSAWLRPGTQIPAQVLEELKRTDSYRDVAVLAIPLPDSAEARAYRIADLASQSGLSDKMPRRENLAVVPPPGAIAPLERVMDLTAQMDREGRLTWEAPAGRWLIIRFGHASNLKMTRPCPAAAVGLECDRLAKIGIDTHFDAFLKKIIEGAGPAAGGTLGYVHIDSWEAGGQNWTATFPAEFRSRRGYDLHPWIPVMTGRVVGDPELSERFLWDVRATVGEMTRDNYAGRLRELAQAHGMKLSTEAYGTLCIDNLAYAGNSDLPMSEYWAMGQGKFPVPGGYEPSSKAMASASHVYGKPVAGAESFTGNRGWQDHPFLLKAMGDKAFCRGINRFVMHLSAHQPRNDMIPGMTHRRWGEHFQRHNTWWNYIQPWTDYLRRCQYLLQQGTFVADVCYWFGEGAPLSVNDMNLEMPAGYDFDFCTAENVLAMKVEKGWIVSASGMQYRYLLLPDTGRFTVPLARKLRELVDAGARVIGDKKPQGAPGLTDYPRCDNEVAQIGTSLWDTHRVITGRSLSEVFRLDGLQPDFEGQDLLYIHRRVGEADVYFVSHQDESPLDRVCTFRVSGKRPELWDPETGAIRTLPTFEVQNGRISVPLHFEPMQSWFVVFRTRIGDAVGGGQANFTTPRTLRQIDGEWEATFDPRWGGPDGTVSFDRLSDWSKHPDPRIHYYSGTVVYRKSLTLSEAEASGKEGRLLLDLGAVEIMARVRLNGKECGIVWKPHYLADITPAARVGANELEIDVVNLWINRMIGDEQLPEDSTWKDFETLAEWPAWFKARQPRPSGRFTFTTCKHYAKDTPLVPSGLLGPVTLKAKV
jgi:hypothetical protein